MDDDEAFGYVPGEYRRLAALRAEPGAATGFTVRRGRAWPAPMCLANEAACSLQPCHRDR